MAKKRWATAPKTPKPPANADTNPETNPGMSRRTVLKAMGVSAGAIGLPHALGTPGTPAQQTDPVTPPTPPPAAGAADAQKAPQLASVADGEFLTTNTGLRISDDQNTLKDTPEGRKVAILAGDGVNAAGLKAMQDALLNANAVAEVVGTHQGALKAADGSDVPTMFSVVTAKSVMYDAVYVPGGADSVAALTSNADAVHFVQEAFKHYKPIGAAGEGGDFLNKAAIKADDPGVVVADTGAAAADLFLAAIGKHRFWDRDRAALMPA